MLDLAQVVHRGRHSNVDTMDAPPLSGRSINDLMLESLDSPSFCVHGYFGIVAHNDNVVDFGNKDNHTRIFNRC